jgi:hypothetical protein
MKKLSALFILTGSILCSGVVTRPADAQFYSLDGMLECVRTPGAVCYDTTTPHASEPIQSDRPAQPAARPAISPVPAIRLAPDDRAPTRRPAAAIDPLQEIAMHLQARAPAPGDLSTLRSRAEARDGRALELLAWCEFIGLGVQRDPVFAYLLYGAAAAVGVPNAAKNQAAIYETALAPAQRQQILDIENSVQPPPRE